MNGKSNIHIKKNLWMYMSWPGYVMLILVVFNLLTLATDLRAGITATIGTVVIGLVCLFLHMSYRKNIMRELVAFSSDYAHVQKQLLQELAVPYILLDEQGKIIWMNKAYKERFAEDAKTGKSVTAVLPQVHVVAFPEVADTKKEFHVTYDSRKYCMEVHRVLLINEREAMALSGSKTSYMFAAYFFDETDILAYIKQIQDDKLVAGLIYLDNYDEALESIEEVRRSLLVALIDRKINKYISTMGGILRKIEKDKYFVVFTQKRLEEMKQAKFDLLEEVKTVKIGNEMAVTISIGLGINGANYLQNYEYSRIAIDMALARGGDQVVLKDNEHITYYGGKTQTMEKNTRVKARVKAHALRELIETKDRVVIMGHQLSDVDSIGAAIGVYRAARFSGKRAHIVLEHAIPSVKPLLERFTDNTDYEKDMFIGHQAARELTDHNTVLVVVDVNRPSYTECPELLRRTNHVVVFDHHRRTKEAIDNAVLSYVEPYASSACEMVAELLQYYGENIRIRPLDADAMYAGIVIDTNNFVNQTGIRTFEAAAFLRRNGADVTRVRKLFRDDMDNYKARAEAVRHAELLDKDFAVSICGNGGAESKSVIAAQAANELMNIKGVKASFVLSEIDGKIFISARSIDEVNVQIIMEKLGGGGHMNMAGAQLKDVTLDEAKKKLCDVIRSMKANKEI